MYLDRFCTKPNSIASTQIIRRTRALLLALALHDALHPAPSVALNPTPDHDDLLLFFLRRGTAAAGPQTIRFRVSLAVSCAVIVQYRKASPRASLLGCRDAFGTALLPDKRFQFQYKKLVLASLVGNGVLSACVSDRQRERACLKFGENDGLEDGYYAAWLLQVFLPVRV